MTHLALACCILLTTAAPTLAAAPAWLRQASQLRTDSGAAAVVLLDTSEITISPDGRLRTVRRYAVHVRRRDGRDAAAVREVYVTSSGRVRAISGWVIAASGQERDLGDDRSADVALVDNDIYNEVRARILAAGDAIADGEVFGAEVESEDRLLFAQLEWSFAGRWPIRVARRSLTLPSGWTATSLTFNHATIDAKQQGTTSVWELRDLPETPDEEWMPALSSLAPRVAISIFAPPGTAMAGQFSTWADVSTWLQALSAPPSRPHEAISAKAKALIADLSAHTTEFDRIATIARYVQRVQYVSIQTGLGRGGGYQPRPPELVLQRNYGDCKDKAHLMRAMLEAIGVRSYLVSLFSGDRDYVRAEWPSPQQFNHAIIAVALSVPVPGASVLAHPTLGPLLIFDPTDEFTPLGELPREEQGSLALITAAKGGTLERLPRAAAASHGVTRAIEGRLGPTGDLNARVRETARGAEASARRALFGRGSGYQEAIQRRVSSTIPGARVAQMTADDANSGQEFSFTWGLVAPTYGQPMGQLLLVRPPFNLGGSMQAPAGGTRRTPIVIESAFVDETIDLEVPTGFTVDEMPPATSLDTVFGRYSLTYSTEGTRIVGRRHLEVQPQTVPLTAYDSLRTFFEKIRAADTTPFVLKR